MFLIDFNHSRKKAFVHGFVKGLAAPVMLFHFEYAPVVPQVPYLMPTTMPIHDVLANDWLRIGEDMTRVIERHGKATEATANT